MGGVDTDERPEVVRINNTRIGGICTGVFVNDTTMLTAAHCLSVREPDAGISLHSHPEVKPIAHYINLAAVANRCTDGSYPKDQVPLCPRYDLAILVFEAGTGTALGAKNFPGIADRPPKRGETIFLFGFGGKKLGDAPGPKNTASGKVSSTAAFHFVLEVGDYEDLQPEDETGVLHGDSGGPVFNDNGEIVGISSGMRWWRNRSFRSFITKVHGDSAKAVFDYAFSYRDPRGRPGPIKGLKY